MVGLCALGQAGIFDLYKVADMHILPQIRTRAQACKRANARACTHPHALAFPVYMGKCLDDGACLDAAIGQHAMGPDAYLIAQVHLTFKHTADIDLNVPGANQRTAHINAGRILQSHALLHQSLGQAQLMGALQGGQLRWTVHASHRQGVVNPVGQHLHTVLHRQPHHIREVILALGVAIVQPPQPLFKL